MAVAASAAAMNNNGNANPTTRRDNVQNQSTTIVWKSPPNSFVKINFDDFVYRNSAAGGFIIRDYNGQLLFAVAKISGNTIVLVVEATTLGDSLASAQERGYRKIEVEGYSKLVIDDVNGAINLSSRLIKII
ncbi:uncharacterized protein LOC112194513 [Rosa chinensis]|uniref:uncharacterized protein LOC112194513 n=1 Tax=Rosa chinensis TaxID=74649 RepID=UPI000D08B939|nr:uncharacterized protein LOC112194513 [Rosa chinensis]